MRRLVLRRSPTGLGLNIVKTGQGPFVITAVVEGKAAALGGEIKVNDLLHAVDTTSLYDLDEAQTKALVAGTPSQLGTNVALWIQAAPNGSGTPIQAQVLAKLKDDKDALHAELANLKAEFKALQLLFVTSQAELDRLKGKDTGEAVLTETDEDEIQRLQQEATRHLRAVKEHRKALRRLQHAARNPELNKPVSASDAASAATLSRKTQDLVQGLQHLHDDLAQGLQHLHDDALDEALVSELATDTKNLWLLRRQIAADPQAFFAQADTSQDGSLDRNEWAQACAGVLGHAAPDLANALFDMMDFDKSGHVSMGEFVEIRRAVRLFVVQAGFQELAVESLSGLVYGHLSKNAPAEEGTSLAEQTLDTLTELSLEEMRGDVAPLYASLKEHGEQVKQDREARAKKLAAFEVEEAEGKFTQLPTAAYGDKDSFHKGLEVIGMAHPDVLTEMKREFLEKPDSKDPFTAWNSGPNETTCEKEWYFVADPFEDTHGWQDLSPEEWTPRFEYGGNRIPIRVQVFMHVMSAYPWNKKERRFGDYKQAHKLDKSDPRWLHEKEVDKVKLVLCRYIKSQLDGTSLVNAFKGAKLKNAFTCAEEATPGNLATAEVKAELIIQALSEGLHDGGDGSASTCTFAFLLEGVVQKDAASPEELEALMDHFHAKLSSQPITEPEVIAGRGYTGPPYVKMNASLRFASKQFPEAWTAHLKGNKYTNAVYACNSLLRKFSQISHIPRKRKVFRGMSGVKLPECFMRPKEGGGAGGVDFGFVSTTTDRKVATSYLGNKALPVLFQFEVGDIDRGASLSFLSQYPNEDEILIPPLSYLEVTGEPFLEPTEKGEVWVYPARINCNLKAQTIEEIDAHRQKEVLALVPYIDGALRRDMPSFAAQLVADLDQPAAEKVKTKLEELQVQILSDFDVLCTDLATREKISWLNQDANYKKAIGDVIDFKHHGLTRLVKAASDQYVNDTDPRFTGLHVAAAEGRCKIVAALVSAGAPAGGLDQNGSTALCLACGNGHEAAAAELMEATKLAGALDLQDVSFYKQSALHMASKNGLAGTVAKLLSLGADAALTDKYGKNALCLACYGKHEAAAAELMEATKLAGALDLQDHGAYKRSALHWASAFGLQGTLVKLLSLGADVAPTDANGKTALWLAVGNGHETAAAELMEATKLAGALDLQDVTSKQSALHFASAAGLEATVAKLLSLGADAALADKKGKTPVVLARKTEVKAAFAQHTIITDDNKNTLLLSCARFALASRLRVLLQAGANVEHTDKNGNTALELAKNAATFEFLREAGAKMPDITDENKNVLLLRYARNGAAHLLRAVLQAGANADHTDENGKTALCLACGNGHEAAAAELMEATKLAGALDLQDKDKRSALHMASEKCLTGTVAKLLLLGADAALADGNGKTALRLAHDNGHEEAAAELKEATKLAGALDLQDDVISKQSASASRKPSAKAGSVALRKLSGKAGAKAGAVALRKASAKAGAVATFLSLGADAAPEDADGKTPFELADKDEAKEVFAEHESENAAK